MGMLFIVDVFIGSVTDLQQFQSTLDCLESLGYPRRYGFCR